MTEQINNILPEGKEKFSFKKLLKYLKYSFYPCIHPFKGFHEIKNEKKGSIATAMVLLALFVITSAADGYFCGYLFNPDGGIKFNIFKNTAVILMLYILWCIANWCLTSLFDGEGKFNDICIFTAYALVPLIIIQIIKIPLSNALQLDEASFYTMIEYIGWIWFALLLLVGNISVHQYTLSKTLLITVCTIAGMCIIVYILLLFFNMFQQMLGFVLTLMEEINLRFS